MLDFSSLGAAATETITRFHNYAKNVETAHLGKLYTTVINGLDYYVVECAAKPALAKAPEWVSSNRVVNFIQNNKGLTILAAGIITLIFIVVMLHPPGDVVKSTDTESPDITPETSDDEEDSEVSGMHLRTLEEKQKHSLAEFLVKWLGSQLTHQKDSIKTDSADKTSQNADAWLEDID